MGIKVLQAIKSSAHGRLIRHGVDIRRLRPDRVLLERRIFPFLLQTPGHDRLLFVGCAWYTQHYPWIFRGREFWTLEYDASLARFGAERHIIDSCERVADHFPAASLDVVICNGVYGYGLDTRAAFDRTIDGFRRVLRPDGLLVFGWNDLPHSNPLQIAGQEIFGGFRPAVRSPLGTARYEVPGSRNRHTYEFLERE